MDLMGFPPEIVHAILTECVLSRSLGRAMRLRLVSKFFDKEITKLLADLRLFDQCGLDARTVASYGPIFAKYISRRLLSRRKVPARFQNLRDIASQYAKEDAGDDFEEVYAKYINLFSDMASRHYYCSIRSIFMSVPAESQHDIMEWDRASAAALTGRMDLFRKCTEKEESTHLTIGTLADAFKAAVEGAHYEVIDYLLEKTDEREQDPRTKWWYMLEHACLIGSIDVVQHLLSTSSKWEPRLTPNEAHIIDSRLNAALSTPSVAVFKALIRCREKANLPPLDRFRLHGLFSEAVRKGWLDLLRHLLDLGVPEEYIQGVYDQYYACPNLPVMELLMNHGTKMSEQNVVRMCHSGQLEGVMMLLRKGAVEIKNPRNLEKLLLYAMRNQHEAFARFLVEEGAILQGNTATYAQAAMLENEFEHMYEVLKACGGIVEDWDPDAIDEGNSENDERNLKNDENSGSASEEEDLADNSATEWERNVTAILNFYPGY